LSGNYEIKSSPSGLSLGLQGDSTANAAPVMQNADTGDVGASWALVPESNGYYEIKNALTGQLLNVSAASGAPGALVVQWPADGLVPGNDQWLPVQNPDGSWSFYNRYSQLALDDRQHRRGNEVRAVDAEQHREAGIHPDIEVHLQQPRGRPGRGDLRHRGQVPGPERRQPHQQHRGPPVGLRTWRLALNASWRLRGEY